MTAGDRFAEYRSDVPGAHGDGLASNLVTRAVLRELCRTCHDSGVVQIGIVRLQTRIGVSPPTIKRALARLQSDEWITRAVRGTGNRHDSTPRETVWVLHQLVDAKGEYWPNADWVQQSWQAYLLTERYLRLSNFNRRAVLEAFSGAVDNPLLGISEPSTRDQPRSHMSQDRSLNTGVHYREAERRRRRLRVMEATR